MKRLFFVTCVAALAALGWAPGSALAGPLLSGYGGPGDGEQVILGSHLINGPGGGRGGGGSSLVLSVGHSSASGAGRSSTGRPAPVGRVTAAAPTASGGNALARAGSARANSRRTPSASPPTAATGAKAQARRHSLAPASVPARPAAAGPALHAGPPLRAGESGLLGLSGSDLVLTFALVCVLGLMALAVRRLARPQQ